MYIKGFAKYHNMPRYEREVFLLGIFKLKLERIIESRNCVPLYIREVSLNDVAWYLKPFCIVRWEKL